MIERVPVAAFFGISTLFMLLVLINLLHEWLRANGRIEELRRARPYEVGQANRRDMVCFRPARTTDSPPK